ncbi:MAG: alpha/beta hydrolase [Rhodoglobus sp.]|nr:alpha/beta hydrolase [Rhodoglobus sp.]
MAHRPWYRRPGRVIPLAFLAAAVAFAVFASVSPWPAALTIRAMFEKGAADTVAEMSPYAPDRGIDETRDVAYADEGANTTFDAFSPSDSSGPLPTVVWIHGGAWISGNKSNVDPYVKILAARGFTTVSLNYTIAPEATYPTALKQLNTALGYLVEHAGELRIDPNRIVIAGDSAGAQYTAQLATLITSPKYAATVGIVPSLSPTQLRAVVLNCGIYDVSGIPNAPGIGGWGFRIALWAYLGTKDWSPTPGGQQMSTLDDVTADFPQTWISGGNADPLTATQSKPFAAQLTSLGVPVTSVFYDDNHVPALPHEYQFHLDFEDAQTALDSTVKFLDAVTAG